MDPSTSSRRVWLQTATPTSMASTITGSSLQFVKLLTIRLVLIIAAAPDYNFSSLDIRPAYLQAEIKEDLFMRVPPGVSHHTLVGEPQVCKLHRSLYSLRQVGREWAILLSNFILKWGFTCFAIDVSFHLHVRLKHSMAARVR